MAKAFVIGNGPSLTPALLESLDAPTFAVNRIWKIFEWTSWRPDYYIRAEMPTYNPEHVKEDLNEIGRVGCVMYLQDGFRSLEPGNPHPRTRYEYFRACDGVEAHAWHLPTICGYGTVIHIAMQIAVTIGFDEIELIGCDLGLEHFYDEFFTNEALARDAHEIAARCCPSKVISSLEMYGKEKEVYRTGA